MKKLIVSSGNQHKIKEIKDILKELPIEVISKNEIGFEEFEVIEDGETLKENAIKKAVELSKKVSGLVVADDTGLFVDALNGEPGVYSSRYAGENVTYEDNNNKLLKELLSVPDSKRTAKFVTVMALAQQGKVVQTIKGECNGKIAMQRFGEAGFGYDPLFIVDEYNKTFAELGDEIKNEISHRANALKKLREELEVLLEEI
ncbi:XTP/dITP diphosphatase [Abyssisolibacter fermentans]|uniref:XTP/dITP diphosphatase n=1 Tax=Abyssisolibacter fermentans TaxID=1766203 RepID=UPI0009E7431E|nr:XTP/dITP diphosphatase [Abyssisolibacter fermentans]